MKTRRKYTDFIVTHAFTEGIQPSRQIYTGTFKVNKVLSVEFPRLSDNQDAKNRLGVFSFATSRTGPGYIQRLLAI